MSSIDLHLLGTSSQSRAPRIGLVRSVALTLLAPLCLWAMRLARGPMAATIIPTDPDGPVDKSATPGLTSPVAYNRTHYPLGLNHKFMDPAQPPDRIIEAYGGKDGKFTSAERREIAAYAEEILASLGPLRGLTIADIGAGTGLFTKPLSQAVGPTGLVIATELSDVFCKHLRAQLASPQAEANGWLPGVVRVVQSEEKDLQLPAKTLLDLVLLIDVYHHLTYPLAIVQQLYQYLRPAIVQQLYQYLRPGGRVVLFEISRFPANPTSHPFPWFQWHVRADRPVFQKEIESCGLQFLYEAVFPGIREGYCLVFRKGQDTTRAGADHSGKMTIAGQTKLTEKRLGQPASSGQTSAAYIHLKFTEPKLSRQFLLMRDQINELDIVLASQSPRRREILTALGIRFRVQPSEFDEKLLDKSLYSASEYVVANAKGKGMDVYASQRAAKHGGSVVVIAADTVVVLDGRILEKPSSRAQAKDMLLSLSGRTHTVLTGVAVLASSSLSAAATKEKPSSNPSFMRAFFVETRVRFIRLTAAEAEAYVDSGEPMDKAGAYGVQGLGSVLVDEIQGSFFNVMGLPAREVAATLAELLNAPFQPTHTN
eukprot:g19440.t1